jgi:hypothetical protein
VNRSTPLSRRKPLERHSSPKRGKGFVASNAQRLKVAAKVCVYCGASPCDPAHVLPRSLGGCSEPECVVSLCRRDHRLYDEGALDLLPSLERSHRAELAHAVEHAGLLPTLRRVTNRRWAPVEES